MFKPSLTKNVSHKFQLCQITRYLSMLGEGLQIPNCGFKHGLALLDKRECFSMRRTSYSWWFCTVVNTRIQDYILKCIADGCMWKNSVFFWWGEDIYCNPLCYSTRLSASVSVEINRISYFRSDPRTGVCN